LVASSASSRRSGIAEKGTQQRVVAGAGLMRTGDDCIDDPEFLPDADPSGRDVVSGSYDPITGAGVC